MATPFDFDFNVDQVSMILKNNPQVTEWFAALYDILPEFDIYTRERVGSFLAQTAHESANYTILHENLNYKPESLIRVWPSRFNAQSAAIYGRKPEMIANKVYADRMGNGNEASGDGWKYRGRGILQITGKVNYTDCSFALYGDDRLVYNPELIEEDMSVAVRSACWFWSTRHLNQFADEGNITEITKRINGGLIGLDDRVDRYTAALTIFQDMVA
jgi:putative chitinase